MKKINDVIHNLPKLIITGSAESSSIDAAEEALGLKFATEYREFLVEFGSVLADGLEITGITKSKNRNVVDVTKREWELNPNVEHNLYVIENIGIDGIVVWQNESGDLFESSPSKTIKKVADSIVNYILSKK